MRAPGKNAKVVALITAFCKSHSTSKISNFRTTFRKWFSHVPKSIKKSFNKDAQEACKLGWESVDILLRKYSFANRELPDIFGELLAEKKSIDEAKRIGAIFTPYWLASKVTKKAFHQWHLLHRDGSMPEVIGDVSCGAGVFLYCVQQIADAKTHIVGIDLDLDAIHFTELLNWVSKANWNIYQQDAILSSLHITDMFAQERTQKFKGRKFDILVGNPPFVRNQTLDRGYADSIRQHYSRKGMWGQIFTLYIVL